MAILFTASGKSVGKPKNFPACSSRASAWRVLQRLLVSTILSLLPLLNATPALAQDTPATPNLADMSLEDLMSIKIDSVYGASGFKQKVTEAPASVTIITSEEIQRYGYRTLADILRNVRGFYVTYDRNYSYLGVRGYGLPGEYNNSIALLIDGHRLNDNIFDAALIGTEFPIDVDLIDRVEVIRGPNSSLYVASAFLGVINIITKRGRDLPKRKRGRRGGQLRHLPGPRQLRQYVSIMVWNCFFPAPSMIPTGRTSFSFTEFDNPATNNGIAVNADDDEFHQLFANVSWGGFTLHGVFGSRDKGIPTAPFGTVFNVTETRTIDAARLPRSELRSQARPWVELYQPDVLTISSITMALMFTIIPRRVDLPDVLNKNFAHGKWWGEEVTFSKQVFETPTIERRLRIPRQLSARSGKL